jgi:hypothetical protein
MEWTERWPNHWVTYIPVSNQRVCISVFKHRDIGDSGPMGGLSRWKVSLESPWAGVCQTLKTPVLSLEEAQAQSVALALEAIEEALGHLQELRRVLTESTKTEGGS